MTRDLLSSMCAVALIGLLGACGGDQTVASQQAVTAANPGHGKGALVYHSRGEWFLIGLNASPHPEPDGSTLYAEVSSDPEYGYGLLCLGDPNWCGDTYGCLGMDAHEVVTPSGNDNWWGQGLIHIRFYSYSSPVGDDWPCRVITLGTVLAEGETHITVRPAEGIEYTWAAKGTLPAPGCPPPHLADFALYGPISDISVYASMDFACSTK